MTFEESMAVLKAKYVYYYIGLAAGLVVGFMVAVVTKGLVW